MANPEQFIQWFGVFPKNIRINKRPIKTLTFYDLIVASANLEPFFKVKPSPEDVVDQSTQVPQIIIDGAFVGNYQNLIEHFEGKNEST